VSNPDELAGQPLEGLARRIAAGTRHSENWYQLIRFGLVGTSGYFVNLAVFSVTTQVLSVHHIPAAVVAFVFAVTNNFVLNRHWTFKATEDHPGPQAARFLTVSVAALGINLLVLALLVDVLSVSEVPGQAVAVAFAMPFNFLGNRLWTFS
jgi:dolichol-phosphate mannosyltransferase